MPKEAESVAVKLRRFVREFKDVFSTDEKVLFCNLCEKPVQAGKRFQVNQHVETALHKRAAERKKGNGQSTQSLLVMPSSTSKSSDFNFDLCKAMLSADIPLYKLENSTFKLFLEKYTQRSIPSSVTLRRNYVTPLYQQALLELRTEFNDKDIWLSVDETTDAVGRNVVNVVVGILDGKIHEPASKLLQTSFHDRVNHSTIAKAVTDALQLLWPDGILYDHLLLLVTDGAPYMIKAGSCLKVLFTNMIHLTCMAHALHRVCEEIRDNLPDVDALIASVKKVFCKAYTRIQRFKDLYPNLPLPPEPVVTRWGTWLMAACYYSTHWDAIAKIIAEFDAKESKAISTAQALMQKNTIKCNLAYVQTHFSCFIENIETLEKPNVSLCDSLNVIEGIKTQLQDSPGVLGKSALKKC